MRIRDFVIAAALATSAPLAAGSQFKLQLRDYAQPGQVSDFRIGGACGTTNSYVFPPEDCGYGPSVWSTSLIGTSTDETLSLRVSGLIDNPNGIDYDRSVIFKETGTGFSGLDDVLRIQVFGSELRIDFYSGEAAREYVKTFSPTYSVLNSVNEEIMFGPGQALSPNSTDVGNLFDFGTANGPLFDPPVVLSVIPTAVPEPATAFLVGALAIAIAGTSTKRRRAGAPRRG